MKKLLIVAALFTISDLSFSQSKTKEINPQKTEVQATVQHKDFSVLNIPVVYTFIGNGNWSDPANWDSNGVPPGETAPGSSIHIHSTIPGAQCILDVPYTVTAGTNPTTLIVYSGNNLEVPGNLTVK